MPTIRSAQVEQLRLICELVDAYDTVPALPGPGAPRLIRSGSDGTPEIDEFLVAELHPLLGTSPASAWALMRDAINLRERHPHTWRLVQSLTVETWQARKIAQACSELTAEAALSVDAAIAPSIAALPWARVSRKLAGLIMLADTEQARQRREQARLDRFAEIRHAEDGMSWLIAHLPTADAVLLQQAIGGIARGILADPTYRGSTRNARADALTELATPHSDRGHGALPRPDATLVVHLDRALLAQQRSPRGVARVEGPGGLDEVGPALLDEVRELLAHHRVRVLPVIDLNGDPTVDSYEVPDRMKTQIALRDSCSAFPFATRRARACDIDHTIPYQPGVSGQDRPMTPRQTRPSNLGALDRRSHRAKTHAGWEVRQRAPGVFEWLSPLGYSYTVDRDGTHRRVKAPPWAATAT